MRRVARTAALLAGVAGAAGCGSGRPELTTFSDSVSYALGVSLGQSARDFWGDADVDAVKASTREVLAGGEPRLTRFQAMMALQAIQAKRDDERQTRSATNVAAGRRYREEFGQRAGVTTTASGLQYEVLVRGTGPTPTIDDTVRVHFRGMRVDGAEFESTRGREPRVTGVTGVMEGWTEALLLMPVGSTFRIVVPPQLAFRSADVPGIGPNATLVYEIQLLEILP